MAFGDAECRRCRLDFPALRRTVDGAPLAYFDGPGGTQVPRPVIDAVASYYETCNANTHGQFATSAETDEVIRRARAAAATFLGAPDERCISFGANMTTLTFSFARAFAREMRAGDEIVVTELDHEANRGPWLALREHGVVVREARLRSDGTLDLDHLASCIGARTRLVAVGLASNALGTVNDLPAVRDLARAAGARLLVDAVHYAPHFPVDAAGLDVDVLLCSAYKFYGPHVGIAYCRPGLLDALATDRLRTQEPEAPYRLETGTLNHAALAGVTAAVEYLAGWGAGRTLRDRVVDAMTAIASYEHGLARRYYDGVRDVPGVTVRGPGFSDARRAPTVSITVDGVHAAEVARRLGARGLAVWDGDFYAVRAVEVLGLVDRGGLIRAGMSMYTTDDEVGRLIAAVADVAASR